MEARCRRVLRSPCRTVPQRGHTCGIYAASERELAEALAVFPTPVPHAVGRVSLWGRVVESSEGFRAQYAYPYELELRNAASDDARTLRERYAVDVVA